MTVYEADVMDFAQLLQLQRDDVVKIESGNQVFDGATNF